MVRSVSEDKVDDTIEFNEFLVMMSKQQEKDINADSLLEALKYFEFFGGNIKIIYSLFQNI